ncbi:MAG: PLP-dependent aminotransferase family protein [Peptostreptococcaceae bacterium]|nr:PLP-dependent aminotransferase family protein [Peptostreptococcaceae bacterium]MDY5738443.1 PLP-dependent aminotransferase family protein [Anaerovoracaceae bacterium]
MSKLTLLFQRDDNSKLPLYMQLYGYIKTEITNGHITAGERLPAIRRAAKDLSLSLTTIEMAYSQLLVEGYVISKPQSGYYVTDILIREGKDKGKGRLSSDPFKLSAYSFDSENLIYDPSCFDFIKWKKAASRVFTEYAHMLFFGSDPQGEAVLRYEISKYAYSSRGVVCTPDQIVIGAGTQQLTTHLSRIMRKMPINNICTETPGYLPIQKILEDTGFAITKIPVDDDGIQVDKLPTNIPSAVYVSPNNQFPTGAVMPIARRYQLLNWAKDNNSYIIEDDYDSELRYFGKPIPALQGLWDNSRVVYLGSFSSTLFPAIRISYMVLPEDMAEIFHSFKQDYTQTCSKAEQLTLALFMEEGHYLKGIKRMRNLYSQKLAVCIKSINTHGKGFVTAVNTNSGLNIILMVETGEHAHVLCKRARESGAYVEAITPEREISQDLDSSSKALAFYYSRIPLEQLDEVIKKVIDSWTQLK